MQRDGEGRIQGLRPGGRPPGRVGLWAGFLDRLPTAEAVAFVREIEGAGVGTIWIQEYSGVDPFIRAALYLSATERLGVALGVAVIHARDAQAMVVAASTLEEAFPGRFVLGLGVSHRALVEARGHTFTPPLKTMADYLAAMDQVAGEPMPLRILGALGPKMVALAGSAADGVHTYFSPVAHTAWVRRTVGPDGWVAPSQMVSLSDHDEWRRKVQPYLELCLGMPNYTANLRRFGIGSGEDGPIVPDRDVTDALVVSCATADLQSRLDDQRSAGADQVVLQFVPPPPAHELRDRLQIVAAFQ